MRLLYDMPRTVQTRRCLTRGCHSKEAGGNDPARFFCPEISRKTFPELPETGTQTAARGAELWTRNRRARWKVTHHRANMGGLLLGACPSGVQIRNTGPAFAHACALPVEPSNHTPFFYVHWEKQT